MQAATYRKVPQRNQQVNTSYKLGERLIKFPSAERVSQKHTYKKPKLFNVKGFQLYIYITIACLSLKSTKTCLKIVKESVD
jgi:hypothetical protein